MEKSVLKETLSTLTPGMEIQIVDDTSTMICRVTCVRRGRGRGGPLLVDVVCGDDQLTLSASQHESYVSVIRLGQPVDLAPETSAQAETVAEPQEPACEFCSDATADHERFLPSDCPEPV